MSCRNHTPLFGRNNHRSERKFVRKICKKSSEGQPGGAYRGIVGIQHNHRGGNHNAVFQFLAPVSGNKRGVIGVILFAVMTGASATVLRASIMALLALTARATGRIYTVSWALFFAGFFMVLQNPKILRFDTSFQLSFWPP